MFYNLLKLIGSASGTNRFRDAMAGENEGRGTGREGGGDKRRGGGEPAESDAVGWMNNAESGDSEGGENDGNQEQEAKPTLSFQSKQACTQHPLILKNKQWNIIK